VRPLIRRNQADYLERSNEVLQVLRLPIPEQMRQLEELEKEWTLVERSSSDLQFSMRALLAIPDFSRQYYRNRAHLQTARVALAVERYRLKLRRWPESLDQLVPEWLSEVSADPYTGKPLLYRHRDDGVVIYSVGPNHLDDGGKVVQNPANSLDLGMPLWDPAQRGCGMDSPAAGKQDLNRKSRASGEPE